MLRKWDGELRYLPNFKFRRFGKKDLKIDNRNSTKNTSSSKLVPKSNEISKKEEVLPKTENVENSRIDMEKEDTTDNSLETDCAMIVE